MCSTHFLHALFRGQYSTHVLEAAAGHHYEPSAAAPLLPAIPSDMPFYILPVARLLFYGIFSNVAVSFDTRIQLPQLLTISGKFLRNLRVSTFA